MINHLFILDFLKSNMKLLVIDNFSVNFMDLRNSLKGYDYDVVKYNEISPGILRKYDKIILSGGHAFDLLHRNNKYKKEMELIKKTNKPLLGICLGFQLICKTYGARLGNLKKYEHGLLRIRKKREDSLLKGINNNFWVFENHRHIVTKISPKLISLAESKDGVETVKHAQKSIWGTQFHPEHFIRKSVGRKILRNFLDS